MSRNPNKFLNIVADLEFDQEQFERMRSNFDASTKNYVMLFTPRSGSTWLTSVLSGKFGHPNEYLNPNFVRSVAGAMQTKDPTDLLDLLSRKRKTSNGVFGIQVRCFDITLFDKSAFFEKFGDACFFHVWRRNLVAQGISLYKAVETGLFHSFDKDENVSPPEDLDEGKVLEWIRHILEIENGNVRMLKERGLEFRDLIYEDLTGKTTMALKLVAEHIGEADIDEAPADCQAPTAKVGDSWNVKAEAIMREKHAKAIAQLESERLNGH